MLAGDATARTMTVTPIGVMAFFDKVLTERKGHLVTELAKRGVFVNSHVARVGNHYPISVLKTLLVIAESESVAKVGVVIEELLE